MLVSQPWHRTFTTYIRLRCGTCTSTGGQHAWGNSTPATDVTNAAQDPFAATATATAITATTLDGAHGLACTTVDNGRNDCVFPFVYGGQTYSACTAVHNDGVEWCATTTTGAATVLTWGTCGVCSWATTASATTITTTAMATAVASRTATVATSAATPTTATPANITTSTSTPMPDVHDVPANQAPATPESRTMRRLPVHHERGSFTGRTVDVVDILGGKTMQPGGTGTWDWCAKLCLDHTQCTYCVLLLAHAKCILKRTTKGSVYEANGKNLIEAHGQVLVARAGWFSWGTPGTAWRVSHTAKQCDNSIVIMSFTSVGVQRWGDDVGADVPSCGRAILLDTRCAKVFMVFMQHDGGGASCSCVPLGQTCKVGASASASTNILQRRPWKAKPGKVCSNAILIRQHVSHQSCGDAILDDPRCSIRFMQRRLEGADATGVSVIDLDGVSFFQDRESSERVAAPNANDDAIGTNDCMCVPDKEECIYADSSTSAVWTRRRPERVQARQSQIT